jgi:hypothetical protein
MITRTGSRLHLVALVAALVFSGHGCASEDDEENAADESLGSIGLNLSVQEPLNVSAIYYEISRTGAATVRGSLSVGKGGHISLRLGDFEPGTDYFVFVSGTTVDGNQTCSGQTPFHVVAGQVTSVDLSLFCQDSAE